MSRYTDAMERARGLFGKKAARAVNGVIPLTAREPYCWGCSQGYSTFKIGKYVYHSIGHGGASGCSIADAELRKAKGKK